MTATANNLAQQFYWVANGANPLPPGVQFSMDLPPTLPFRRFYFCAYFRDATFCNAIASFRLWLQGNEVLKFEIPLGEDGGATLASAGARGPWVPNVARPPFQVTDQATGLSYQDTVATGENGVRFVWRLNGRDISAFCPPTAHVVAADRLTMNWDGPLNVTSAASALIVAAAAVKSGNYPL